MLRYGTMLLDINTKLFILLFVYSLICFRVYTAFSIESTLNLQIFVYRIMKIEEGVNMRTIRLRLNEVMAQRGLTQTQLAELSGVRQAAISEMSRNIREQINLKTLVKIADALEIDDISELLVLENEEKTRPE